jgi:predicted secreted protein
VNVSTHMWRRAVASLLVVGCGSALVQGAARADSTPIGTLPKGPRSSIASERGTLVAIALPRQKPSTGLVWRLARRVDPSVLRQVSEGEVGSSVVVVFRAVHTGSARVVFALTRGDSSSRALRSRTYTVRVR